MADGRVPRHADARTGEQIVFTADLRTVGLLLERDTPHGLAKGSAGNVLRDLDAAFERARAHGADLTWRGRLTAISPLGPRRINDPKPAGTYIPLAHLVALGPHLPVDFCASSSGWLVGDRIGEVYGLRVADYFRDESGRGWLVMDKQGGASSLGRDRETGRFDRQDSKDHTKTPAGVRTIPIPSQLAALLDELIRIFHTDPETGEVLATARLIPGIQREDVSGQSSFRTWLKDAQALDPGWPSTRTTDAGLSSPT